LTRKADIGRKEHWEVFIRAVAGADVTPAGRCPSPASNDAETAKKLVAGRVSTRRNGDSRNECQETFIHTVAGAGGALAYFHPSRTSKTIEEIYFSTINVSKQWAASSTLPTVMRTRYLPPPQTQMSSKAHQCPS
jgi:hypothetical protein